MILQELFWLVRKFPTDKIWNESRFGGPDMLMSQMKEPLLFCCNWVEPHGKLAAFVPLRRAPCCHLSPSCWTSSPLRVMVCRSAYCGWPPPPLWPSAWVSGWTMDMCTFRLCAFSKRLLHIRHWNSRSSSALCLVMWYFKDARWRHWKPHTSHLEKKD